jgi:hypothetical protein
MIVSGEPDPVGNLFYRHVRIFEQQAFGFVDPQFVNPCAE